MIVYILIAIAAVFNAINNTCAHHYSTSIFRNLSPRFWDATNTSWRPFPVGAKRILKFRIKIGRFEYINSGYPLDAWHISKSIQITSFIVAVVVSPVYPLIAILYLGIGYNLVFNIFYDYILRKRK